MSVLQPLKAGSVTVEDVSDNDFDADEDYDASSAAAAAATRNGGAAAASAVAEADRSGLSPGEEGAFDVWLRTRVNQPLLALTPEWVPPNFLSLLNTGTCWGAFSLGYLSYKYEHLYPDLCALMRVTMAFLFCVSMVLDCLDGMQARKTGRCSKLGELLDHALDSANIPLCTGAVLHILRPDVYTILISLIGSCTVYNAQLVIYRHAHVFVLPPVTGPVAQVLAGGSLVGFALFFRLTDRHDYLPTLVVNLFALIGNITQLQNSYFFGKRLLQHGCHMPHVRFTVTMMLHGLMLPLGFLTVPEYLISAVLLAYRLNGSYVLDTLVSFKPFSATHTREHVRREDSGWKRECVAGLLLLLAVGCTMGTGTKVLDAESGTWATADSATGLPYVSDSLFHALLYCFMALCVAINIWDLKWALPALEAKQ